MLLAVDLADQGLADEPDNVALQHVAVLALARAGATEAAARRFEEGPLAASEENDALALGARLAKDLALASEGNARVEGAQRAALRYAAIGGSYPLINAATLSVVAGDDDTAARHASDALTSLEREPPSPWTELTRAEALIVLGRVDEAGKAVAAAVRDGLEPAAGASAFRQLALLCEARGVDAALLAPLRGPGVLHYCGHVIGERFSAEEEAAVSGAIAAELDREPVASGYGALAAGADLLVAEALLERGAELHVVLPCDHEDFVAASVRPSGERWVERFERCLAAAEDVTVVTPSARQLDDGLLIFSSELAMGLALLRARWLYADIRQLAIWDRSSPTSTAGTGTDVATWRGRGGRTVVISPPRATTNVPRPSTPAATPGSDRKTLALLFADVAGYSKIADEDLPRVTALVLDAVSDVLARHADSVLTSNSWGDAVLVVAHSTEEAARIALEMRDAIAALDPARAGVASPLALRLGAHVGPVFVAPNSIRRQPDVVGEHVNRTARLEPVTPPGEVYATDAFAASLELAGIDDLACEYVGHLPGAKDIGRMRMHRLRRVRHSDG